ncbi:LamG-like jellyroll fold domain-containing protein [Virgisporangium aliadipatigenens]|uniref:LamG-like jellyroll fold domain-containing protein n=1 Tax=Virgisporangium aliadipatigenens TaxID=741659 RepID=UPI001942DA53|nr:LamG-like jellyroll fold domain-containing protein [Virgisporangium aliadipatigenens]
MYANPSGTTTVHQHAVPTRVRRDGGWVPIDPTLRATADGVRPVATLPDLRFSPGGDGPAVTQSKDGVQYRLSWPARLPVPRLDGDTATYPEVLPGVDLQLRALRDGFSKILVVKDRAAADNPALDVLRFSVDVRGGTIRSRPDGGLVVADKKGTSVFASDPAAMWDRPQPPPGHPEVPQDDYSPRQQAVMPIRLTDTSLEFSPDLALLRGPDTAYPVYIDPSSHALVNYHWTHVNKANRDKSYWNSYRDNARVGYSGWYDAPNYTPWRTFLMFHTWNWYGKNILNARFSIDLDHSASCDPTEVDLWHTVTIHADTPTTWNNTENGWYGGDPIGYALGNANQAGGCAGGNQPDMKLQFEHWKITNVVSRAAAGEFGNVMSLGLRAPNEGDEYQWKKFHGWSAVLSVEYNTPPTAPAELNTVPPSTCGPAQAPTRLGATMLTPGFSAHLRDDDANLVTGELQVLAGSSDTVVYPANGDTAKTTKIARAAVAVWPPVPLGVLRPNVVYSYRARTNDGTASGAWTDRCYFIVDDVGPGQPAIESADFPEWTPIRDTGELGTVTFRRHTTDTDIAGFQYGFDAEQLTGWIPADPAGQAQVPMTLWPKPGTGLPEAELYVRAVDYSGNLSPAAGPYRMQANDTGRRPPGVTGDVNGDGKGDATAMFAYGDDRLRAWTVTSAGDGFHTSYVGWDTGRDGSSFVSMRPVTGDFNDDGLADQAIFRQDPDGHIRLFIAHSHGHRLDVFGDPVWTSPTADRWTLANLKVTAGNIDGVGGDDLVALSRTDNGAWTAFVWTAATGHTTNQVWYAAGANQPWGSMTALVGDFDADGRADLATVAGINNTRIDIHTYTSTGTGFATPALQFTSGGATDPARQYDFQRSTFTAGNVDGDTTNGHGRDDIIALISEDSSQSRIITFSASGTGFTDAKWWPAEGPSASFDSRTAMFGTTDLNGDRKDDLTIFTDCCTVGNKELWTFTSTGTAFGDQHRSQEITVTDKRPTQARWRFDDPDGASGPGGPLSRFQDDHGTHQVTTAGGPSRRPGHRGGQDDQALSLNGTQWAATAGPVVRTDRSFTVTAWAHLDAPTNGAWRPVIAQDGEHISAFTLRASGGNAWAFSMATNDTTTGGYIDLQSDVQVTTQRWTHLAGVYEDRTGEMRLYVNGVLAGSTTFPGGFHAYGQLHIGRNKEHDGYSHWAGGVDDVRTFNHVKTPYEILELANRQPDAHWKLGTAHQGTDIIRGTNLTIYGPPAPDKDRVARPDGALHFDGTTAQYCVTADPVIRGNSSFTVAAWLKLDATGGTQWRGAVSQDGNRVSKFFLRYAAPNNEFVFTLANEDRDGAPHTNLHAPRPAAASVWTHVTGVYDAPSRTAWIYINGEEANSVTVPNTITSTGPVNIGRDKYDGITHSHWTGSIDDVRLYNAALDANEIRTLAATAP